MSQTEYILKEQTKLDASGEHFTAIIVLLLHFYRNGVRQIKYETTHD